MMLSTLSSNLAGAAVRMGADPAARATTPEHSAETAETAEHSN